MKTYHSEIAESICNLPQNTKFTCRSAYEKTGDELFKRRGVSHRIKHYSKTTVVKEGVKVTFISGMPCEFMWHMQKQYKKAWGTMSDFSDSSLI